MRERLRRWFWPFVALFIATIWLNQSVIRTEWEVEKREVFAEPTQHWGRLARYPFVFLYRRSGDEELYFFTASQILGKRYDGIEEPERGEVPPSFRKPVLPADGKWHAPYAEVPIEYPPLLLPFIVLPRWIAATPTGYGRVFGALMGAMLMLAAGLTLRLVQESKRAEGYRFFSFLLLAHGALAIQRLDAVVALLLACALVGLAKRRPAVIGVSLGLVCAAKLVPLLLVPAMLACDLDLWKSSRARAAFVGAFAASLVGGLLPMFVWSPTALSELLAYHGLRGLQVESTLGTLYSAVTGLIGQPSATRMDYGSYNFVGAIPGLLGKLCMPLSAVVLGGLAWSITKASRTARGAVEAELLACVTLAALSLLWLSAKVFSPQYLTWGFGVVLVLRAREKWLFLAAVFVTQLYLRGYYDYVYQQHPIGILTMVVRQSLLCALAWWCVKRWREEPRTAPLLT